MTPQSKTARAQKSDPRRPWLNDPVVGQAQPQAKPWANDPIVGQSPAPQPKPRANLSEVDAIIEEAAAAIPGGYEAWAAKPADPQRMAALGYTPDPLAKSGYSRPRAPQAPIVDSGHTTNLFTDAMRMLEAPIAGLTGGASGGGLEGWAKTTTQNPLLGAKEAVDFLNPLDEAGRAYLGLRDAGAGLIDGDMGKAAQGAQQFVTEGSAAAIQAIPGTTTFKGLTGPVRRTPTTLAEAQRGASLYSVPGKPPLPAEPSIRQTGKTLAAVAVPGRPIRPQAMQAIERILLASGVPRDRVRDGLAKVVKGLQAGADSPATVSGRAPSISLLLKREFRDDFPEVATNLDLVRLERRLSRKRGDASPTIIREAVKDIRGSQASFLIESATRNAGATTRNETRENMEAALSEFGEEGYKPILSQPIDDKRAQAIRNVLSGPGMGELGKPLRQIAAGQGKTIEEMIAESPLNAAHWMQHKARLLKEENAAKGNTTLANAYDDMRNRILSKIDDLQTPDGKTYRQLRIEYADTAQIGSALKSADQFGAMVKDPEKANNFVKAFNASTPAQQEARLASIGDWMLSKLRGGGEDAPARMAELQSAGVLETLDRLGQKGKALADDIRAIRDEEMDLQTFFPKSESQSISNAVALAEGPQVYSRPGASSLPVNALADAALMGAGVASAPIMTAMRQGPRLYRGIMQPRTATREDMTRVLVARPRGPTRPPATQQALPAGPANALNPPSPVPAGPPVNPLTPPRRPPEQSGFGGSQPRRFETPEQADAEYARLAAQLDEKRVELFTANRKRSEAYEGEQRTKLEATYKAREKEIAAKMPAWEKQFMEKNAGRYDEDVLADRADDYAYAMYNRETAKLDKWRDSQEDLISDRGYKFMDRLDAKVEKWYDAQYEQLADSFDDTDFGGMVRANSAGIGGVGGAVGGYIANPVDANGDGVIDDADRPLNAMGGLVSGVVGGKLAGAGANKLLGPRRGAAAGRFRAPSQQTFGGVNAKTADKAALARAQNMEAEGASRDAIWDETGWFKGVDGKWRFEIDDSGAKLGPKTVEELTSGGDHGGSQRTLAGALHHKELYDAYPQLRNAEADIRVNSKFAKPNGAWVADNEGIRGGRNLARVETNSLEDARSILLHEAAGHGVQDIEGFARGGAMTDDLLPSDMAAHNHDQLVKRSRDIMAMPHVIAAQKRLDELKAQWQGRSEIPADVVEELKAIQAMPEKKELARIRAEATGQLRKAEEWGVKNLFTRDQLFDGYRRLAGEVEARNLQTRDAMRLRGEQPGAPWTTQDVPDDQQIVRFGSGRAESRGAAPKAGPQKPPAQSGFGGGAAAPDVAAHVAMAKEQGFNTDKVYYHGAAKQFEQFDMSKVGQREIPWYGKGAYLSPDKEVARRYATSDQNVMPFFVRGKLLKVDKDSPPPEWLKNSRDWSATLTERGYSGLEIGGKIPELVVFNPSDLIRATPPKAVSPDAVRYTAKPAPWDKTGKSWVVMDAETGTDTGGVMSKAFAEDLVRSLQKPKR